MSISKEQIERIKNEFIKILAANKITKWDEDKEDDIFTLAQTYAEKNHMISDLDLCQIVFPDVFGEFTDIYIPKTKVENIDGYFRTLDSERYKKEFNRFSKNNISDFKDQLKYMKENYLNTSDIYKIPNIISTQGAPIPHGSIKRLMNQNNVSDARKVIEFRLNIGKGAKPTLYNCIDPDLNFIYLGTCHLKNNTDKGEISSIAKAVRDYQRYLNLKDKSSEKYFVDISEL